MEQSTATFPNIIRSLDKLKILQFWGIMKENNPLLLDPDYDEHKEYPEEVRQYIVAAWEVMYDSYYQVKNDSKTKLVLHNNYEQMVLGYKIYQLEQNINMAYHLETFRDILPEDNYTEKEQMIYKWFVTIEPDLPIKYFEGMGVNLDLVKKRIAALQNKYNRNKKDLEKQVEKQVENVYSVIVKVSEILGMQLNAENMMVLEWIRWEKAAIDKQKALDEANRKRK